MHSLVLKKLIILECIIWIICHYDVVYSWSLHLLRKLDSYLTKYSRIFLNSIMLLVSKVFSVRMKHIPCWAHVFWYFAEPAYRNFMGLKFGCFRWLSGEIQWGCMYSLEFWQNQRETKSRLKRECHWQVLGLVAWLLTENSCWKRHLLYTNHSRLDPQMHYVGLCVMNRAWTAVCIVPFIFF